MISSTLNLGAPSTTAKRTIDKHEPDARVQAWHCVVCSHCRVIGRLRHPRDGFRGGGAVGGHMKDGFRGGGAVGGDMKACARESYRLLLPLPCHRWVMFLRPAQLTYDKLIILTPTWIVGGSQMQPVG